MILLFILQTVSQNACGIPNLAVRRAPSMLHAHAIRPRPLSSRVETLPRPLLALQIRTNLLHMADEEHPLLVIAPPQDAARVCVLLDIVVLSLRSELTHQVSVLCLYSLAFVFP